MKDTPEVSITFEDTGTKGRYVAQVPGYDEVGELTVTKTSDVMWIADHTGVPDSMRGLGVAKALVEHLVADSRANGRRIIPLCPYVKAQYSKHPEWKDVFG